jgi:hypothetical protein
MARSYEPIEPMDLANMRENGVRSLAVQCHQCRHQVIVNADHWPGDLTVKSFGPRMVCTRWGIIGAGAAALGKSGPERGAPARFPSMLFIPVGGPPSPFKVVVSPAGGTK